MRIGSALRFATAGLGLVFRRRTLGSAKVAALALSTCMLAGCGADFGESEARPRLPLPKTALLTRQPAPNCEYRTASLDTSSKRADAQPAASDGDPDVRTKLDYERQCYRHAELIARTRLKDLQDAVKDTVKAVKRTESSSNTTP
jgi:hypothetical protein